MWRKVCVGKLFICREFRSYKFLAAHERAQGWWNAHTAVGLLLILGLQTRLALIVGGLMMTALTFGTMQTENFQNAWLQLTYALVFFVVLALRSWNRISLDALMGWDGHS